MFGGHDTISSTITFCWYMSRLHKYHQKLLQDETETAEGKNILDEIQKMELHHCFVKGTFRLYTPVRDIGRNLDKLLVASNT